MKKTLTVLCAVSLGSAFFLGSMSLAGAATNEEVIASFRETISVPSTAVSIKVPTVIEVPLDGRTFEYPFFEVKDSASGGESYLGNYFRHSVSVLKTDISILSPRDPSWNSMIDGDYRTYASFVVPENSSGVATIELSSMRPLSMSALTILLDREVALPNTILVHADTGEGPNTVVLNTTKMSGNTVRFPKTSSNHWTITLSYSQPLRISEIIMNDEDALRATTQGLRFLATPGHSYTVYLNPDRNPEPIKRTESGDLVTDKGVLRIGAVEAAPNPAYVIADVDQDGIPDMADNCVSIANPAQEDVNQNKTGDVCEDFDRDGIMNAKDNCPNDPNVAQTDTDGDKLGDACDGEESRITEKNAWLPWAGMGFALLVIVGLLFVAIRSGGLKKPTDPTTPVSQ